MVTIKDIAKQLGVSVSTVSRALNNHPDIRKETREKVMELAKKIDYTPNALARSMIQKKTFTVGLMVPDITDPFFSAISHDVEDVLSEKGYQTVYSNTGGSQVKESLFLSSALERKMDGLIITPDHPNKEILKSIMRAEIPVVYLRRRPPAGLDIPFVDVDHYHGSCEAVEHLLSLGHREIGFIGMPEHSSTGKERNRGYVDTLQQNQIDPISTMAKTKTIESGYQAMDLIMKSHANISAIFAANDQLAIGTLEWLAKHDIAVPEEMSVIGFDNLEISDLHWIKLTTVSQPRREMGRHAAEMLLLLLQKEVLPTNTLIMNTELVVRNTTGTAKPEKNIV